MSGFRVDADALTDQAADLDRVADRMRAAAAAAQPLDLDAYGVIGRAFALVAVDAVQTGSTAVGELAAQAGALAGSVRAARAAYLATEQRVAATFGAGS